MDKALAMHTQAHEEQGITSGKMLKEKMGDGAVDLKELGSALRESNLSIGIESVLDNADSSAALFKNYRLKYYRVKPDEACEEEIFGNQDMIKIRAFEEGDWPAIWRIIEPVFRTGETYAFSPDITEDEARRVWIELPSATFVAIDENLPNVF